MFGPLAYWLYRERKCVLFREASFGVSFIERFDRAAALTSFLLHHYTIAGQTRTGGKCNHRYTSGIGIGNTHCSRDLSRSQCTCVGKSFDLPLCLGMRSGEVRPCVVMAIPLFMDIWNAWNLQEEIIK